jgi:TolB protein
MWDLIMKKYCNRFIFLISALLFSGLSHAVLEVEITGHTTSGIQIIVAPFTGAKIIEADLRRSGRFILIDPQKAGQDLSYGANLQSAPLQASGADYLVVGRSSSGLELEILNVSDGHRIAGYRIPALSNSRRVAHKAADLIFEKLTKTRGAFDTRIAYITASGNIRSPNYRLIVADSDGYNPKTILSSHKPILSPTWSPNAENLAYVSYESGEPAIYIQNLRSGSKRKVSARAGMNNAPAWSPDGSRLAMSLSINGKPDIFVQNVNGGALTPITRSKSIDTEPSWSSDGHSIIFTSNRSGKPQLYRVSASGGNASRVTFGGSYNSDPSVVGNKIALVRQVGSAFNIAIKNLGTGADRVLSRGRLDESPSLAPNGTMVIYGSHSQGKGVLAVSSDNGKARQILYSQSGDVRDPAWSPYLR